MAHGDGIQYTIRLKGNVSIKTDKFKKKSILQQTTFFEANGSAATTHEVYRNWMPGWNDTRDVVYLGPIV